MMVDISEVGNAIIENAKQKLGDEIALIVYTGSRLKGTSSAYSDLDLYYVPHSYAEAHCTLVIDQTPIDFFPLTWNRLECWANYDQPHTSAIVDSQIVYSRSAEDRARFEQLKTRIFELQQPENHQLMVNKATTLFKQTGYHYFLLDVECTDADLFAVKREAWKIVEIVLHSLAVMNQTFYHSDCGKNLAEVLALPKKPAAIEEMLATIVESADDVTVKSAVRTLLQATQQLLTAEHQSIQPLTPFTAQFRAYYPEIREQIHKILAACDLKNAQRALSAVIQIQNEVADFLSRTADGKSAAGLGSYAAYNTSYQALGLPDLIGYISDHDFAGLQRAAADFDRRIQAIITQHGVALNIVTSVDELNHLDSIWNRL